MVVILSTFHYNLIYNVKNDYLNRLRHQGDGLYQIRGLHSRNFCYGIWRIKWQIDCSLSQREIVYTKRQIIQNKKRAEKTIRSLNAKTKFVCGSLKKLLSIRRVQKTIEIVKIKSFWKSNSKFINSNLW